jgi:hypothetical protein
MERIRMNTKRSVTWSLLAGVAASAAMMAMPGCELLVDFDRSKIPSGMDATFPDAGETSDAPSSPDGAGDGTTPTDGGGSDATTPDAADAADAADAETVDGEAGAPDTGADAPTEAASGMDSGPDAIADAAIDGD